MPSAQVTAGAILMACRALARRAMMAQAEQRKRMGGRARAGGTMRMAGPMRMARSVGTIHLARPEGANMMRIAGGAGLAAAGIGVARWMASRPHPTRDRAPKNRWIMVTINCSPERLASRADLPEPITRLGDAVDIKICPAPGDRGTELGARLREMPRTKIAGMVTRRPEGDPRLMVERALREAKSMIEAGEVLRPDWPVSAPPAQVGKLLEFAGRRGGRQ